MISKIILIIISTMILCNCGGKPTPSADPYTSIPLKSEITAVQPMTGIVLWSTLPQVKTDAISLEFSYLRYNEIVNSKGEYDWHKLDSLLSAAEARGHQMVIRFWYTYVAHDEGGVPQYIREIPGYEETHALSEGRMTCFPDWRCEELRRFHLEFYEKLAERYDNDRRLAFLETGFGLWAEYHIYDGPYIVGQTFPSIEFQKSFFEHMDKTFHNTPWMVSIDSGEHGPFKSNPELKNLHFGLFDDSFMHETHGDYNQEKWDFFGLAQADHSPRGGEFSYYTDFDQRHVLDETGMYGRIFENEAAKFRITFMIGNDQPRYQTMDRIKTCSMACGYRYRVLAFEQNSVETRVYLANTGVAPIYRDAYVTVDGVRCETSLRQLQPGQQQWYTIKTTGASPKLTISCDHLVEGQTIQFEADIQ